MIVAIRRLLGVPSKKLRHETNIMVTFSCPVMKNLPNGTFSASLAKVEASCNDFMKTLAQVGMMNWNMEMIEKQ